MTDSLREMAFEKTLEDWASYAPGNPLLQSAYSLVNLATRCEKPRLEGALVELSFLLEIMPRGDTDALQLDLAVIQQVMVHMTGQTEPDRVIIPVYDEGKGRSWKHQERILPIQGGTVPVHLVFMDRGQQQPPDLRAYVWLIHELIHVIFARHLSLFAGVEHLVAERVQEWKLAGLASDDPAGAQITEEFRRYWTPGRDQEDWPHEIAVDTVCMVLLGPAYAEALHRHYRDVAASVPPYRIEPSHIPLELRTRAMIQVGELLGWGGVLQPLRELQEVWEQRWPQAARASRYRALRDDALIAETQRAALAFCEKRHLRHLTPQLLAAITGASGDVEQLGGLDLIIAAWWVERRVPGDEYHAWVERAVGSYAEDA